MHYRAKLRAKMAQTDLCNFYSVFHGAEEGPPSHLDAFFGGQHLLGNRNRLD